MERANLHPNIVLNIYPKEKKMKNISIIAATILIATSASAGLKFNEHTGKFYSEKASYKVNQDEYNTLMNEITDTFPHGFIYLTDAEYAAIFCILKMRKSPASKQLSADLKQVLKRLKKNIKRIKAFA
jgi:hypothetical protein